MEFEHASELRHEGRRVCDEKRMRACSGGGSQLVAKHTQPTKESKSRALSGDTQRASQRSNESQDGCSQNEAQRKEEQQDLKTLVHDEDQPHSELAVSFQATSRTLIVVPQD